MRGELAEMSLIQGIQNAIHYIEDHITEKPDFEEIAKQAYVSNFHFQRAFSALCGFSLGEYIRHRKLTLAGMELSSGKIKVSDIAIKYGYDSPDSFTKAFVRFHEISPSSARKKGAKLRSVAPLKINLRLEGGNIMDYRIEAKEAFTVIGRVREISGENAYEEIPKFWQEHYESGGGKFVKGMFGIGFKNDKDGKFFDYMIADCDDGKGEMPENYIIKTIPESTWAVFPIKGAMPKAMTDTNTKIWREWIPNCRDYEIADDYCVEMYSDGDHSSPDYYSEIWIPVK